MCDDHIIVQLWFFLACLLPSHSQALRGNVSRPHKKFLKNKSTLGVCTLNRGAFRLLFLFLMLKLVIVAIPFITGVLSDGRKFRSKSCPLCHNPLLNRGAFRHMISIDQHEPYVTIPFLTGVLSDTGGDGIRRGRASHNPLLNRGAFRRNQSYCN